MKIRLYETLIDVLLLIGVGVPLIFGGALDSWRTILTVGVVIVTILYVLFHKFKQSENNKFLCAYIIIFSIIIVFEIIKGKTRFNYSFYEVFYALRQYIWIVLSVPIYYIIVKSKNIDRYLKRIVSIVLISLGLRTITWFFKNYLGITVFRDLLYEYGVSWSRSGKQRLDATALISVAIPIVFYLYAKYKKKRYICMLAYIFFYLLCVAQTRTLILGCILCVIAVVVFKRRSTLKTIAVQLTIFIILYLMIYFGGLDFILDKMNISINDSSIGYRYYEYTYYSSLLKNGEWITGIGIVTELNYKARSLLFGNLSTKMYLGDLGVFECFFQFGIFTILLYGGLLVYIICLIMKCKKIKEYNYLPYLYGQFFYIAIVSLPLNLFGIQRIFAVPVILAIICAIDHIVTKNKNKSRKEIKK